MSIPHPPSPHTVMHILFAPSISAACPFPLPLSLMDWVMARLEGRRFSDDAMAIKRSWRVRRNNCWIDSESSLFYTIYFGFVDKQQTAVLVVPSESRTQASPACVDFHSANQSNSGPGQVISQFKPEPIMFRDDDVRSCKVFSLTPSPDSPFPPSSRYPSYLTLPESPS